MTTVPHPPESSDASVEELLREVGVRSEESLDAAQEVMSAVHAEWLAIVQQRRREQRAVAWKVAAGLALALLVSTLSYRFMPPGTAPVASIAYVHGQLLGGTDGPARQARMMGQAVRVGETLQTDARSRAAVAFPGGLSLRLDHDTRLTFSSGERIDLSSGAVYIDAPPAAHHVDDSLTIETFAGSVQHVGTQYEVRMQADAMLVSVREGRVLVRSPTTSNTGEAGQVLRLDKSGGLSRSELAATDPYWQWTLQAVPAFDIENQSLAAFLQWIARETGRQVVYASPQVEAAAAVVKLRGSIEALDAETALAAVLSTTQFRRYPSEASTIGIDLMAGESSASPRP